MRPVPYTMRPRVTAFVDYATGQGVTDAGRVVRAEPGRRKRPTLGALLDACRLAGVQRVYLTGPRPPSGWLLDPVAGWQLGPAYLDLDTPRAPFTHTTTGETVELRRAAEWYGGGAYSTIDARDAHALLARGIVRAFGTGAGLLAAPSGTAVDLWARTLPRGEYAAQLDDDVAELVHATSTQGRVELFTADAHRARCDQCVPLVTTPTVPGFVYYDGRIMYAAMLRELGAAPARRLTAEEACDLWSASDAAGRPTGIYARARYHITAVVPDDWHGPGLLLATYDDTDDKDWHAPNAPGAVFTTWCDAAELHVLDGAGWPYAIHGGLAFTAGRPLDRWASRLLVLRAKLAPPAGVVSVPRQLATDAIRTMIVQGIGAFHSRGRDTTYVTDRPLDVPAGAHPNTLPDGRIVYRRRTPVTGRAAAFHRPELSAQVWGRARAALLSNATGTPDMRAGMLHVPPDTLIGCYTDALYLTADPGWPDDGRPGRFRRKGNLTGPHPTPTTAAARNDLRAAAENGATA